MKKDITCNITGWLNSVKAWICSLLVAAILFVTAGCYGSFPLTHLVYTVNGNVAPSVLRQVTFWVFLIIPVYGVASLGDIIVLNLIEFWTGEDFGGFSHSDENSDMEFVMVPSEDGQTADLEVTRKDKTIARATFIKISDKVCEARSPKGRLLAKAIRMDSGAMRLENAEGDIITILPPRKLQAMKMTAELNE